MASQSKEFVVRPSELVCVVCRLGAVSGTDLGDKRLNQILSEARKNPRREVRLACYDELGQTVEELRKDRQSDAETLKDRMFLRHILFDAFMRPIQGKLPLLRLLMRAADRLPGLEDVCLYETADPAVWPACPSLNIEDFKKGQAKARRLFRAFLPEYYHSDAELLRMKKKSVAAVYKAKSLRIFPPHLLFVVSHYGSAMEIGREFPLAADDMMEVGRAMRLNPEIPVTVVDRHCMLCPSCVSYDRPSGLCKIRCTDPTPREYNAEENNLRLLREWGLNYNDTLPAAQLLRRLFDVPTDRLEWYWNSIGAPAGKWAYTRGREAGAGFLDAYENLEGAVARVETLAADPAIWAIVPDADKQLIRSTLRRTRTALEKSDHKAAYQAFVNDDERFYLCWKGFLEEAARGLARFPKSVTTERRMKNDRPIATAHRATRPPRCDGRLNDAAWRKAPFSAGFLNTADRPSPAETGFKVLHDSDNLYVGVLCAERDTRRLRAEARIGTQILPTERGTRRWLLIDDAVILCIQPDETKPVCYQFMVNSRGVKLGEKLEIEGGRVSSQYLYENDWHAAANVDAGLWSVEAIIPFDILGLKGKGTSKWRMNVTRLFRNDYMVCASWSNVIRTWHATQKYGTLSFAAR